MLKARNLVFPGRLNVPELSVPAGSLTIVLGSNGAGKSTLLAALAGLLSDARVEASLNDLNLLALSVEERAKHLALLTQRQTLDFDFTVEEVLRMGLHPLALKQDAAKMRFEQIVRSLDLQPLLARRYPTLSRGEAQRTQIGRILMQRAEVPGVVLLDEPLTALDLRHQQDVMQLLVHLKGTEGHTFIVVLHDLNIAAQFGDQFLLLERGELVAAGDSEVLQPPLLSRVFEIEIQRSLQSDGQPQFKTVMTND